MHPKAKYQENLGFVRDSTLESFASSDNSEDAESSFSDATNSPFAGKQVITLHACSRIGPSWTDRSHDCRP